VNQQGRKKQNQYYKEVFIMKWNKVLQGTLVVAAAAATWVGAGAVDAAAADPAADITAGGAKIKFIASDQTLKITEVQNSAKEILFAVGTVKNKKTKITAWDVYDYKENMTIDLSKLSNTKDNYLLVRTEKAETPAIIKIPAVQKTAKATIEPLKAEVKFGVGARAADATAAAKTTGFEYRTIYGSWKPVASESAIPNWSMYQEQGATLYFRTPGLAESDSKISNDGGEIEYTYNGDTEKVATTYVAVSSLPGKEAKLTIAKKANGPSVAVDYTKGTVKLPRNSEYRVVKSAIGAVTTVGTSAVSKGASDFFTTDDSTLKEATVEVRAIGVDKKKAASKWTRVVVDKPANFGSLLVPGEAIATPPSSTSDPKTYTWGGKGVAEAKLKETSESTTSLITAEYIKVSKKDAIKLTNNGTDGYQIVVQADGKTAPAQDARVTATLKARAGSTVTLKNVANGSYIYVRKAGNKNSKTWVGLYQCLGVVDYPQSVTVTAAPATSSN